MCGIAGIYAYRASSAAVDLEELRVMRDAMQRRGPDGCGEWRSPDGRIALGHRRLSIIDLSDRASQPMHTSDGLLCVTFNGEIYNYIKLRAELERKGYVFRTTSDTEVLLHLYRDRGVEMLQALRGMYAFALWDTTAQSLLLARDPYGIKPLYFADQAGTLRFASQAKALIAGGRVSRERDPAGEVGFYLWGFVPEPHTIRRAISAVPAGSYVIANAAGVSGARPHFSIAQCWSDAGRAADSCELAQEELHERVRCALRDSVEHHLVADVPVSAFLSGGIDSGALVGLMSEQGSQTTHAITLAFDEFAGRHDDEAPIAAAVATHYGLAHHVRRVDEREFHEDLPAILTAMDQPTIDGLNTWFVSKATREQGLKVAVSGLGGDELFGGYPSFQLVPRLARALRLPALVPGLGRGLRSLLAPAIAQLGSSRVHPKLASAVEYGGSLVNAYQLKRALFMPWELPALLPKDRVREGLARLMPHARLEALLSPAPRNPWAQVAVLEASHYMRNQLLRDADWASMAHSLEVRVPLVDHVLLTKLAASVLRVRGSQGKRWLATSPNRPVPEQVRARTKTGFSTPIAQWLQRAPLLNGWRAVPMLAAPGCPWARRFAYAVAQLDAD